MTSLRLKGEKNEDTSKQYTDIEKSWEIMLVCVAVASFHIRLR